jgi:hypothetical protein
MNQDGLACLDAGIAVEHLPCRDPIDQYRFDKCGIEPWWNRNQGVRRNQNMSSPAPYLGYSAHARSNPFLGDAGPNRADGTDQVVSGNERKRRLAGIPASAHPLLGERHSASLDLDERLASGRCGKRAVSDL